MKTRSIRVGVIDDHPITLIGFSAVAWKLTKKWKPPIEVVKLSETVDLLLRGEPGIFDVVALDLSLEDGSSPADNVGRLVDEGYPVLIYTGGTNVDYLRQALAAGAAGIALKTDSVEHTLDCLRRVAAGETVDNQEIAAAIETDTKFVSANLSPREQETLSLIAAGYTHKQAAVAMNITDNTVDKNIFRIRKKYAAVGREARTKLLLHIRAQEDGLIIPHR
ncbi:DNA-binding response regulator (plasmid) [Pseudarthrobacter psychrotolerans]|uniref:DNA-binding response regulator n=1 Tax=Pseudarthrobacter psychrotolerans TaxID=2697569 RepID=A0A6P1NUE5_9MICC|nr:LuxR C-terminal-related transcriptional regulator [Pseudarthrobacter psychrotolerans]QHK22658.1 DNA-binding response regulator [Pseudarthrobacter psychrotolerans]